MTNEPRVARVRRPAEEAEQAEAETQAEPKPQEPQERVTPRDLRRARRKAKRLGLSFQDDHEALRQRYGDPLGEECTPSSAARSS